jgi:hypothetical protein
MANGTAIELTNATISKTLREQLRQTACARFTTVLGNGADAYHENHVHIDLMRRTNNYKICQWNILDSAEIAALATKNSDAADIYAPPAITQSNEVPVPRPRPPADTEASNRTREEVLQGAEEGTTRLPESSSRMPTEEQKMRVGPWTIGTSYKAGDFHGCAMSRSTEGMDVTFLRTQDNFLLFLQSQKWNLERGKAYTVRLVTGSRSVEAQALAEPKAVTITLSDRSFNENLSAADILEVRGEGATLRVPLDGSAAALARLDACGEGTNGQTGSDHNPFVAPPNRRAHQVRRSRNWRAWGPFFLR